MYPCSGMTEVRFVNGYTIKDDPAFRSWVFPYILDSNTKYTLTGELQQIYYTCEELMPSCLTVKYRYL